MALVELAAQDRHPQHVRQLVVGRDDPYRDRLQSQLARGAQAVVPVQHHPGCCHLERHEHAARADVGAQARVLVAAQWRHRARPLVPAQARQRPQLVRTALAPHRLSQGSGP